MNAKDTEAIAAIIARNRPKTSMAGMFLKPVIDALADYMVADQDAAHVTLQHRGPKGDCGWLMCQEPFDSDAFIAACFGELPQEVSLDG